MKVKHTLFVGFGVLLIACFQNCAKPSFQQPDSAALASETPAPATEATSTDVICDPFSESTDCKDDAGLMGFLYYLPGGKHLNDFFKCGEKLKTPLILTHLNIPQRSWDKGFPIGGGKLLSNSRGVVLKEYFAMDLSGFLTPPSSLAEGNYQFAVLSDDGSRIELNDNLVVDNDGVHASTWACASSPVYLTPGNKMKMKVQYFQGPRYNISLQVFMRPWSQRGQACNGSGGWTLVPGSALSH